MTAEEQRKKKAQQMAAYYAAKGDTSSAGAKAASRAVNKASGTASYSGNTAAVQKYRSGKTTVQDIYSNRPTKQQTTQAPNSALAQNIVNTVTAQSGGASNRTIQGVQRRPTVSVQDSVLGTGAKRSVIAGQENNTRSTSSPDAINRALSSSKKVSGYSGGADAKDGDSDSVMKSYREGLKQAQAILQSYEKGEGVYDEKDYALAEEEADRYQELVDQRKAQQEEAASGVQQVRRMGEDAKTGIKAIANNPVMWASDTLGSAVDSAASGVASTAATLTDFGANVNEFTRTGDPEWQREQAAKMRNAANANAQSAAQYRQGAIETAGNTDFGAFATDLGVAGAQMGIDAATGGLLKTGTMAPMLVRSFGYGAQEAADAGFGANGQVLSGIKSAGVEYLSEKLFGGNPVYDTDAGLVNKLLGNVLDENSQLIRVLSSKPADIVYEGLEEVVSDLLNPLIDQGALWVTGDDRIGVDWPKAEELLRDFAIGSALSAASNLATGQLSGSEAAQQQTVNQTQNTPVQQTAQEAAQQAPQPAGAEIAPATENADSGVLNTAQEAQEAAPTQTVADIYANRATRQQNIDNAAQPAYTDSSNNTVSGGMADDAGRSAETNRDGVSGGNETGYAVGQGRTGLDGTSFGAGFVLSDQSKSTIQSRGVAFAETHDVSADSAAFSVSLDEARASDAKNGWAVTPKSAQEIEENGVRVYMDENGSVGFGIAPDGDIEAVFANKQKGAPRGSAASIIPQAIAAGGTKLDCYGKVLVGIYGLGGFVPVARVAFNAEYANDGWDASKGTPDIYFMMATDTDADSVVANYGQYKVWSQAELDALPLMEYDEAYAYRDSLLEQAQNERNANPVPAQTTTADGRDMGEDSVSPEDSTGAAPAGFDPVSQWQMEADEYHPVNEEAAQTTLENRGRVPMDIPTTDRNGQQVSKLVSTLVNANITTNEAASALAEDARNGAFSAMAYTDEAAAQKAEEHIKQVGWDVAFGEYRNEVMSGKASKDIGMMGIVLYNNAVNAGALADAMDVASLMVRNSRNVAQSLQVLNMVNKASPESQLYFSIKGLETLVEDAKKRYGKRAENLTIDETLVQEYKDALLAGDEAAKESAWNKIARDVAQQIPSTFAERLNNWRYLAMLCTPRTHIKNLGGNVGFAPIRVTRNMISMGIQSVVLGKTNRQRAIVNFTSKEGQSLFKAASQYYDKVVDKIQSGGKYSDSLNEVESQRQIFKIKPLDAVRKANSTALDVEDTWFSRPAFAYALASYMKANGISESELTSGMHSDKLARGIEYAVKQAQEATYRDSNAFSDWVANLGKNNKVTKAATDAVLPFKRTPANILVRGVEYSPVGLVKGLTYDLAQVKNGNITAADAIDNISSGLVGTGLLALGMFLAAQGLISAGDDADDKDQNWFNDLMGYQTYALNVGDKSITIDWLAPGVMPLFVGAELQKAFANKKMNLSEALQAIGRVTNPMIETSMLSSIDDLMDAVANANTNKDYTGALISSAAASYLGQYIPTLFGQIERATEDKRYETYRYNDTGILGLDAGTQNQLGKLMNKLPGEFGQIPYIDAWGREEESGNIGTRIWNNFFNPAYVNDIQRGEVEEELQRLHDANYSGVLPDRPAQSTKIQQLGGERMTKEEYVQYARTKGSESLRMISELMQSEYYDKLDDDERAELITEIYSIATDEAKRQIVTGRDIEYSSNYDKYQSIDDPALYLAMKETLKDLRNSNGTDNEAFEAVYSQWKGLSQKEKDKYTEGVDGEFAGIDTLKKLDACIRGGMSTEQFYKAKNKHDEINDDESLNASEKRAQFANWLDTKSRFTTAQKRTALSNFPYTTTLVADEGNYEKMTAAGVSKDGGMRLFNAMQELEPAEGYSDVANWQKCEAVTGSSLSDEEQLAALSVYATDSSYSYYQAAYDNGVAPSAWSDVQANLRGYTGTTKSNGKDTYGTGISQEGLCRAMVDAGLSYAQAEAMYNVYRAARSWTNTYWDAMGDVNWSRLGYKTY